MQGVCPITSLQSSWAESRAGNVAERMSIPARIPTAALRDAGIDRRSRIQWTGARRLATSSALFSVPPPLLRCCGKVYLSLSLLSSPQGGELQWDASLKARSTLGDARLPSRAELVEARVRGHPSRRCARVSARAGSASWWRARAPGGRALPFPSFWHLPGPGRGRRWDFPALHLPNGLTEQRPAVGGAR